MSVVLRCTTMLTQAKVFACSIRNISSSSTLCTKEWRVERGLSVNRNAEGILTDGPDYTYLDGRPTPLLQKQKNRLQRQQTLASKIVSLCGELNFAKERYQQLEEDKERERQAIIANRLKPKGSALAQKK